MQKKKTKKTLPVFAEKKFEEPLWCESSSIFSTEKRSTLDLCDLEDLMNPQLTNVLKLRMIWTTQPSLIFSHSQIVIYVSWQI